MGYNVRALIATALLFGAAQLNAAPISCSTSDASANGATADACIGDSDIAANPTAEKTFVNGEWGLSDPFSYVGKYDYDTGSDSGGTDISGFVLSVTVAENGGFFFNYTLDVPDPWIGKTVDWVLGVKQANNSFVSYLFEDVVLGIDGGFNSFWINPNGREVQAYSHASGFLREVQVPEPGTLALLGLGLAGLGAARRTKKVSKH